MFEEDYMDNASKLQAVINTLATLEMPPVFDNVNKMLGIYRTLAEVRDDISGEAEEDAGAADV